MYLKFKKYICDLIFFESSLLNINKDEGKNYILCYQFILFKIS